MEDFGAAEVDNSFELEAKRKEDSSWHPCRVSLSASGDSLIVNFENREMEDMLLKKEEVLMQLRFRSMPLQFDDCFHIEEGERVLAYCKSQSKNLFRDAEVEKVDRIRHSKRGCRCTFLIKWLDHDLKGKSLSVPSSSIMKLATKSISVHQVVHKLLKPQKIACLSFSSPFLTILEGTDDEKDLNKLLEKQIEKISKLADAPEKDFPEDILWRNRAVPDHHHNHLKRTTRSERKLQVDIEAKDHSGPTASMQEEFIQNRSHLSPLASRAALASSLLTAKKCLDMDFSSCMNANMLVKGKDSSEILDISVPLASNASHAISPLISNQRDASCKPSSCVPTKVSQNENHTSGKVNCSAEDKAFAPAKVTAENVTSGVANSSTETLTAELSISRAKKSSADANLNVISTAPIRLTRSAIQKGAGIPNDSIQVKICNDDTKRRIPGNKNWSSAPIILTRSAIQNVIPNDSIRVKNCNDDTTRRIPGNKNRSSEPTICQGNENLANEEENNSTRVIDSDSSKRKIAAVEGNVATMKSTTSESMNPAFAPCNAEIHIFTEERNKRKIACKNTVNNRSNQGQKRKAIHPNKQERRFSPRNFLPRTRSQNKAQPEKFRGSISG